MSHQPPTRCDTFLEPWVGVREYGCNLEKELGKEIVSGHPLYGCRVQAIAQRLDCDDVLFEVDIPEHPYVVVHLSWSGERERDPKWPDTQLFPTWEDWVEHRMKPDNAAFRAG